MGLDATTLEDFSLEFSDAVTSRITTLRMMKLRITTLRLAALGITLSTTTLGKNDFQTNSRKMFFNIAHWAQNYKTFYGRNSRIFIKS